MATDPSPAPPDDLDAAVRRIGDRWTLLVVDALRSGPMRYGELESALAGIAPTVLARRLKDLEADGLVTVAPYQDRPVRMAYELTAAGTELAGALDLLRQWGASQRGAGAPGSTTTRAGPTWRSGSGAPPASRWRRTGRPPTCTTSEDRSAGSAGQSLRPVTPCCRSFAAAGHFTTTLRHPRSVAWPVTVSSRETHTVRVPGSPSTPPGTCRSGG